MKSTDIMNMIAIVTLFKVVQDFSSDLYTTDEAFNLSMQCFKNKIQRATSPTECVLRCSRQNRRGMMKEGRVCYCIQESCNQLKRKTARNDSMIQIYTSKSLRKCANGDPGPTSNTNFICKKKLISNIT